MDRRGPYIYETSRPTELRALPTAGAGSNRPPLSRTAVTMLTVKLRASDKFVRQLDDAAAMTSAARQGSPVSRSDVIREACLAHLKELGLLHEAPRATRCTKDDAAFAVEAACLRAGLTPASAAKLRAKVEASLRP